MTRARNFRCRPEAVPAARRYVREQLQGQSDAVVEAAELMASELATNCVRHAGTDFELAVRKGAEVRVEVRDTGGGRPVPRSPGAHDPSGRGLRIVEAMSDAWGVIDGADGKTVWFSLRDAARVPAPADLSGAGASAQARPDPAGASGARATRAAAPDGGGGTASAAVPAVDPRLRLSRTAGRPRPSRMRSRAAPRRASARPCTPSA
jgi:anti-sigma regulatory factor (Ser/Thr protein kinase)